MTEPSRPRHAAFIPGFAAAALALALVPGFGVAAWLTGRLIWGGGPPANWVGLAQAHGHAQVFGWLGLFIMGVALYFLPRFSGAPLRHAVAAAWIWRLVLAGIAGRCLAQALPLGRLGPPLLALAVLAEIAGVLLYVALQTLTVRRAVIDPRHRAIGAVRPLLLASLIGWTTSALVGGSAALAAAAQGHTAVDAGWNLLAVDLFIGLVLLPVALVFAYRTFPLYLRLPAPTWPLGRLTAAYLIAAACQLIPTALVLAGFDGWPRLGALGDIGRGLVLLYFIVRLDLLTRRQKPWTVHRQGTPPDQPKLHRKPRALPDYGEFGRFEWLLYGAFVWLAIAAFMDLYSGLGILAGLWAPVDGDTLRHAYLGGFATLLLLGMAPRMIPGFIHRRGVAHPWLVDVSFYLAAPAVALRILALPAAQFWPWAGWYTLFGLTGAAAWLAVLALAGNLWATWKKVPAATSH